MVLKLGAGQVLAVKSRPEVSRNKGEKNTQKSGKLIRFTLSASITNTYNLVLNLFIPHCNIL